MKRWCTTASPELTCPQRRSGRVLCPAFLFCPAINSISQEALRAEDGNPHFQQHSELPNGLLRALRFINKGRQPEQTAPLAAQVLAAPRVSAPDAPSCSAHGVIEVKHSHLGPKSSQELMSPCMPVQRWSYTCILFVDVRAELNQCQFTKRTRNRVGCLS